MKVLMGIVFFLIIYMVVVGADSVSNRYYADMKTAQKERDELITLLTEQENQRNWVIAQRDSADQTVMALQKDVDRMTGELALAQTAGKDQEIEIARLNQDLGLAQQNLVLAQQEATQRQADYQVLEQEYQRLQAQIAEKDLRIVALEGELRDLEGQILTTGGPTQKPLAFNWLVLGIGAFFLSGGALIARRRDAGAAYSPES